MGVLHTVCHEAKGGAGRQDAQRTGPGYVTHQLHELNRRPRDKECHGVDARTVMLWATVMVGRWTDKPGDSGCSDEQKYM